MALPSEIFICHIFDKLCTHDLSFIKLAPNPTEPMNIDISLLLVETGLTKSRSEAKRLITQGGTVIADDVVTGPIWKVESGSIIKAGKRRFAKVINSDII